MSTLGAVVEAASRRRGEWRAGAATLVGDASVDVADVCIDHRRVVPRSLFCCLRGSRVDGHDFASAAAAAGATALLVDRPVEVDAPQVIVEDPRGWVGWLAAEVHGRPSESMVVVGVTGTNGKTTCTHLLASVLRASGRTTEVLGTLSGARTTPEADDLQRRFAEMREAGVEAVAMEVSSHALSLGRVDGTRFAAAVFTNLGSDHLDFHGSQEAYFEAKASFFVPERTALAVINADDQAGREILRRSAVPTASYSPSSAVGVTADVRSHGFDWGGSHVTVGIGGRFNVENSLAAATCARALGIDDATIVRGLGSVAPVPGRFEFVVEHAGGSVVVDYAHDATSLARVLHAARDVSRARVGVVFGCGGDRDREKRPAMGRVAVDLADHVVVTSDNPRSEDPAAIARDIVADVDPRRVVVELDRRVALQSALRWIGEGDVLVVAGRGHERMQEFADGSRAFSDSDVIRELVGVGG